MLVLVLYPGGGFGETQWVRGGVEMAEATLRYDEAGELHVDGGLREELGAVMQGELVSRRRKQPYPRPQPWYKRAVALHVAGFSNSEISEILSKTPASITTAVNHPDLERFKGELAEQVAQETLADARGIISEHTAEAALTLVEHMRSPKEPISLRATESILDRGGIPKADAAGVPESLVMEKEELNDIRQALKDIESEVEDVEEIDGTAAILGEVLEEGESASMLPKGQ